MYPELTQFLDFLVTVNLPNSGLLFIYLFICVLERVLERSLCLSYSVVTENVELYTCFTMSHINISDASKRCLLFVGSSCDKPFPNARASQGHAFILHLTSLGVLPRGQTVPQHRGFSSHSVYLPDVPILFLFM